MFAIIFVKIYLYIPQSSDKTL